MGVKTVITLAELNQLFSSYNFTHIVPTASGIIDTTYIVTNKDNSYILKRYEREIGDKIQRESKLLLELKLSGLIVPRCRDEKDGWYIYKKLKGRDPKYIKNYHIQAIARFLSKMHKVTSTMRCSSNSIIENEIASALSYAKQNYYSYYKRFEFLKNLTPNYDGVIHGDIFKDNTIFDGKKVGVIDFIDSSCGAFEYDVAVTLVGFDIKTTNHYAINLFLKNYNQYAVKKLDKKRVMKMMKFATHFFALKRVQQYENTLRAKELLSPF